MTIAAALIATGFSGSAPGVSSPNGTGAVSERGGQAAPVVQTVDPGLVRESQGVRPRSETCPTARQGLRFYVSRYNLWRGKMGAATSTRLPSRHGCPRYLAGVFRAKARAARLAYERWHEYHYAWQRWLPDKWQRIGACETGYGRRPGNWRHNSGTYQGAFGFAVSSWDGFVRSADPKARPYPSEAYLATPRQQYEVALAIWRRYGFSGWGCRGA